MDKPNRIYELRVEKGFSLEDLAQLADTSNQQIWRLENGERRLTDVWMRRLAGPLGVLPHELMSPARADDDPIGREAAALARGMTPDQRAAWFQTGRLITRPPRLPSTRRSGKKSTAKPRRRA